MQKTIDEITLEEIDWNSATKFIFDIDAEGNIVYGYTKEKLLPIVVFNKLTQKWIDSFIYAGDQENFPVEYDQRLGKYVCTKSLPDYEQYRVLKHLRSVQNSDFFPYSFPRNYEATNTLAYFIKKVQIEREKNYELASYFPYTFGFEFETYTGIIPENKCFSNGLIPLRDGSISGLEYATIVLQGNAGLSILEQQLNLLKRYTMFDKDCALHIHIGNIPLDPEFLLRVNNLCSHLFAEVLHNILPALTFQTNKYKTNKDKNYCAANTTYRNFDSMYKKLVGTPYFGNLFQAHPKDKTHNRKWNITGRYFAVNFINALCYNKNKTIEFRFLRPTYNFSKIKWWLYFIHAVLEVAKSQKKFIDIKTVYDLFSRAYPKDLCDRLSVGTMAHEYLKQGQEHLEDFSGSNVQEEDFYFDDQLLNF